MMDHGQCTVLFEGVCVDSGFVNCSLGGDEDKSTNAAAAARLARPSMLLPELR